MRTRFIDYDARPTPKTKVWCVRCQRDLKPSDRRRRVFVTRNMEAVHPEDLPTYPVDGDDYGWHWIGMDCAERLGLEWTVSA